MSDPSIPTKRGRPRKFDRAQVADVAMRAYWEHGPTQVSLNTLCERAGVSKPSVYREFGNDDGLAQAALQAYVETILSQLFAITVSDDTFASKIKRMAHLAASDAIHDHGCLFVKMRAARAQMGPKTQALLDQIDTAAFEALKAVLSDGRATGEWQGDMPVDLGARYLYAQIGLALDQRARGQDPKEVLDLALTVLLPQRPD